MSLPVGPQRAGDRRDGRRHRYALIDAAFDGNVAVDQPGRGDDRLALGDRDPAGPCTQARSSSFRRRLLIGRRVRTTG
ncbi:hypothetical protein HBB16_03305 [Pseudonocardia sp. MCCB 268]|nr:hypothetical protein [Pseudonocardia cytotoxica]